jgi:putative oxidoreductase
MTFIDRLTGLIGLSARVLNVFQPLAALAGRLFVCEAFLRSGWLKISDWEQTLGLFENEYHVPVLPPHVAAVAGTFGELFFPLLVLFGFCGRIGAVGLSFVNVMAVVSYSDVLLNQYPAGGFQHLGWGIVLLALAVYGPGQISVDHLLTRGRRADAVTTASTAAY